MKRSHKAKVAKKDAYLSDDNLADGEENITELKRKRKSKLKTIRRCSRSGDFSISKLNQINTLREKCPNTEFFPVRIFLYSD